MAFYVILAFIYIHISNPQLITGFISENKWMAYFIYMKLFDLVNRVQVQIPW